VRYEKKEAAFDPKAGVSLDYIREKHEEARKKNRSCFANARSG